MGERDLFEPPVRKCRPGIQAFFSTANTTKDNCMLPTLDRREKSFQFLTSGAIEAEVFGSFTNLQHGPL